MGLYGLSFTQTDLDNLKAAFLSGALRVQIGDRMVIYRSQQEIAKAIQVVSAYLSAPTDNAASIQATYEKNITSPVLEGLGDYDDPEDEFE